MGCSLDGLLMRRGSGWKRNSTGRCGLQDGEPQAGRARGDLRGARGQPAPAGRAGSCAHLGTSTSPQGPELGSPGCGRRVAARGPGRGLLLWSQACSGREASLNTPAGGCRSGYGAKCVPSVPGTVCSSRSIGSPAAAPGWTAVSAGPGGRAGRSRPGASPGSFGAGSAGQILPRRQVAVSIGLCHSHGSF